MAFEANSAAFVSWLKTSQVSISDTTSIADLRQSHQGRGLVATADIEAGTVLFQIPRHVVLNLDTCSFKTDYPEYHRELYGLGQWEALMVVLLYELRKYRNGSTTTSATPTTPTSFWKAYFDVLPINTEESEFHSDQLLFWTEDELHLLQPSLVVQRVGKGDIDRLYHELFEVRVAAWDVPELRGFSKREFYEVGAVIMAYSFDVDSVTAVRELDQSTEVVAEEEEDEDDEEEKDEDAEAEAEDEEVAEADDDNDAGEPEVSLVQNDNYLKSMVPLADTLNADTHLHNASLSYQEEWLVMTATKNIAKGDQIYNTYSNHPNSEILRRYGYVETSGSAYDFGEVPLATIKDHFTRQFKFKTKGQLDLVLDVLALIHRVEQEQEQDDDDDDSEPSELVADSYEFDCNQEVLMEFTFLVQILTVLVAINKETPLRRMSLQQVHSTVRRLYHKCYQLIASHKLTREYGINYKSILEKRISEYLAGIEEPTADKEKISPTRKHMAEIVLRGELDSLTKCLEVKAVYAQYLFIDDGKLVRNINKRKLDSAESPANATKKRR